MITINEARHILGSHLIEFGKTTVGFTESNGRVISEDILADRDFPPYNRVTMDGIAVNTSTFAGGQRTYEIEHLQPAGAPKSKLSDPGNAVEVMTGAILPENTDVVIRYEDIDIVEENDKRIAKVKINSTSYFKNIHRKGEDRLKGDTLIPSGTLIGSPEIAILASVGKSKVEVYHVPKTAIVSTGDELIDVDQVPEEHQIRKSNIYAIQNEMKNLGIETSLFHLKDDPEIIEAQLKKILSEYQVLILSGGVSKGKLDFVPEVLHQLGIERHFHMVSQRPGKPLWFGSSEKNTVFALPGNPVSTFVCFFAYIRPWFLKCLKLKPLEEYATLNSDVSFTPNLTYFLQVNIHYHEESQLIATPVIGHGSGDFANLLNADGFMELPGGQTLFNKGSSFPVYLYRRAKIIPDLQSKSSKKNQ